MKSFYNSADNTIWRDIRDRESYRQEFKLDIYTSDGTTSVGTLTEDDICTMSTSMKLFGDSGLSFGMSVSSELDVEIEPNQLTIPKNAMLRPYVRIYDSVATSHWMLIGVYYIDTRSTDYISQRTKIHAYDGMQKLNQVLYPLNVGTQDTFPCTYRVLAQRCATASGVALEDANQVSASLSMATCPFGYSMRELIGTVALSGSWQVVVVETANNVWEERLRLSKVTSVPEETFLLTDSHFNRLVFGSDRIIV